MGSIGNLDDDKLGQMLERLPSQHLEPLWLKMDVMVPPTPNPTAVPHAWKWNETLPHLLQAGKLVPEEQAERRVLMLVNPKLQPPQTTDTIYGGLQIVNPGETAPAHRHIAFAARFIIEGHGFTAVEGQKMPLERGDFVVTPSWHWHDHGNESDSPVIWLDVLNLPLFRFAPVHFAEGYSESRYPSTPCDPCEWRFPWKPVQEILDLQEGAHAVHHYKRVDGKPLSTTLAAQAERIDAGHATTATQESYSFIFHIYEGSGRTVITPPSGPQKTVEWMSRDTFAVPAWSKIQHFNESSETAYIVAVSDRSFVDLLQLTRPAAVNGQSA